MRPIFFIVILFSHFPTHAQLDVEVAVPPFLRQGDRMELKAIIKNITSGELTGQAEMQLTDAQTGESVDGWFQNVFPAQYLTIAANGIDTLRFPVEVPYLFYNTLVWKLIVRLPTGSGDSARIFTQQNSLAIFSNKKAYSETIVLPPDKPQAAINGLLQSENDDNIEHQLLTISAAADPPLLLYNRLVQVANNPSQTVADAADRFFALTVLQSARFKAAWPVVKSQLAAQPRHTGKPPQQNGAAFAQAQPAADALLYLTAFQTSDGGFSPLPRAQAELPATIRVVRQLLWLSQLRIIPESGAQQVADILAKATNWLYRQSITENPGPAVAQALPELFYTYSIMSYSDAAKSRLPGLMQRLQFEKLITPQGRAYQLLGLRNSLSAQHQALFGQITSDTVLLRHPNASAMLLTYAAAEGLEHLKPNLVQTLLQLEGDVSWAAYALLRTFAPANATINSFALQAGTQSVTVPDSSAFFTKAFQPPFIKPEMGSVTASVPHPWTVVTWMYHKEMAADVDTHIVTKNWFKKTGGITEPLTLGTPLNVGDVVTVRLQLQVKSSAYGWVVQDNWPAAMVLLPAATGKGVQHAPGGITFHTYGLQGPVVFEYNLLVNAAGSFSSGPTIVKDASGDKELASLPAQTFYIE